MRLLSHLLQVQEFSLLPLGICVLFGMLGFTLVFPQFGGVGLLPSAVHIGVCAMASGALKILWILICASVFDMVTDSVLSPSFAWI